MLSGAIFCSAAPFQAAAETVAATGTGFASDTVRISTLATTHIRFASDLKYVDISSRAVVAKIVEGSKDILALKAREAFDFVTTVSCLESSGTMHTFLVAYDIAPRQLVFDTRRKPSQPRGSVSGDAVAAGSQPSNGGTEAGTDVADIPFSSALIEGGDAALLDSLMPLPKRLYHIGAKDYGVEIYCDNILVLDDVMYLVFSIENRSAVSYSFSEPRFAVESKKRSKRKLVYEKQVFPRLHSGTVVIAPGSQGKAIFAFDKLTLLKGQVFRTYLYESGGSRNFTLTFDVRDINSSSPKPS